MNNDDIDPIHFDLLLIHSQRIIAAQLDDLRRIGAPAPEWDEVGDAVMMGIFALAALN